MIEEPFANPKLIEMNTMSDNLSLDNWKYENKLKEGSYVGISTLILKECLVDFVPLETAASCNGIDSLRVCKIIKDVAL